MMYYLQTEDDYDFDFVMYIFEEKAIDGSQGWSFVVERKIIGADNEPVWDIWEREFMDILKYPDLYSGGKKLKWEIIQTN